MRATEVQRNSEGTEDREDREGAEAIGESIEAKMSIGIKMHMDLKIMGNLRKNIGENVVNVGVTIVIITPHTCNPVPGHLS